MIVDLQRFVDTEQPAWSKLEHWLERIETEPGSRLSLSDLKEIHYLYERAVAGLGRIQTFSAEPELRRYLENLVARAYAEIHENRANQHHFSLARWALLTWPRTVRRHARALALSVLITLAGCGFGGIALWVDPGAKSVIMPFPHLLMDPSERVRREESGESDRLEGARSTFSAQLMTHNTRVSITAMALGMTWGVGTVILLFYNGVMLGAVAVDYLMAGQVPFLLGWLLPHGAIEIPAILIAGQAGLVLANALVGRAQRDTLGQRLRIVAPDLTTLIAGVGLMLVWAGAVEAFLSQYHEPVLPYSAKIAIGISELVCLTAFLAVGGRRDWATVAPTH